MPKCIWRRVFSKCAEQELSNLLFAVVLTLVLNVALWHPRRDQDRWDSSSCETVVEGVHAAITGYLSVGKVIWPSGEDRGDVISKPATLVLKEMLVLEHFHGPFSIFHTNVIMNKVSSQYLLARKAS
jgi:hypothetical protein